jgi:hypothetical protein
VVLPNQDWPLMNPNAGFFMSSFSILGIAIATGNHLPNFQNRLMRIPIIKTTKGPSILDVILCFIIMLLSFCVEKWSIAANDI